MLLGRMAEWAESLQKPIFFFFPEKMRQKKKVSNLKCCGSEFENTTQTQPGGAIPTPSMASLIETTWHKDMACCLLLNIPYTLHYAVPKHTPTKIPLGNLSLVWQVASPTHPKKEQYADYTLLQLRKVAVTSLLLWWFQEARFIEAGNKFITPNAKSIFLPTSQLYQLAYQEALPPHMGLTHQKNIFLLKTQNVQNCLYRSHSWPCFDITKQTKSQRVFSDKDSLT